MPKYRQKLAVVEAEQFFPDKLPWPKGVEKHIHSIAKHDIGWILQAPDGGYTVFPGDWIVTDEKGDRRHCGASEFETIYELVEE